MTKVISLSDDAYEMLKSLKNEGDSFSDVIKKIAKKEKRRTLVDIFGIAKDDPDFIKAMERSMAERKNFKFRDYSFD